jgi:hypothetical protein
MKQRGRTSPRKIREPSSPSPPPHHYEYSNEKSPTFYSNAYLRSTRIKITLTILLALTVFQSIQKAIHLEQAFHEDNNRIQPNPFALSSGELPGYTGWARPEQTLAGYFRISFTSHSTTHANYHSVIPSGETLKLLLTCHHDDTTTYACPSYGTLFYIRAYGPSVITGNVVDHYNSSYSMVLHPVDVGVYTVEVVVTFSSPLELQDFPLNWSKTGDYVEEEEPGYEGYLVSGFPIQILVIDGETTMTNSHRQKQWCNLQQLTEQSSISSLTVGHWQVIDHVGRSIHQPLMRDDTLVSLDGYRMGLNSLGVRMQYEYEECELMHIRDIVGNVDEGIGHVMDRCLDKLGYLNDQTALARNGTHSVNSDNFYGVHVIFIGDSVMKLEMGFFIKLLGGPSMVDGSRGVNITFIETNGGIQSTLPDIISTLNNMLAIDERKQASSKLDNKRVILFNSGLHDIDILCSSKRRRTRNETTSDRTVSCADAYRDTMTQLVQFIDLYPADLKMFRTTTAGWAKVSTVVL